MEAVDFLENGKTLSLPGKKFKSVGVKQDIGNLAVVGAMSVLYFPALKMFNQPVWPGELY